MYCWWLLILKHCLSLSLKRNWNNGCTLLKDIVLSLLLVRQKFCRLRCLNYDSPDLSNNLDLNPARAISRVCSQVFACSLWHRNKRENFFMNGIIFIKTYRYTKLFCLALSEVLSAKIENYLFSAAIGSNYWNNIILYFPTQITCIMGSMQKQIWTFLICAF